MTPHDLSQEQAQGKAQEMSETQTTDEIETLAYQVAAAIRNRPCGARPCRDEVPGRPSRWCSGCLLSALQERDAVAVRQIYTLSQRLEQCEAEEGAFDAALWREK